MEKYACRRNAILGIKKAHYNIRGFRPQPHSPNLRLLIAEKNSCIEPKLLAQELKSILTELTWQVLIGGYLNSLLLVHRLTFGLQLKLKSIEHDNKDLKHLDPQQMMS